MKKFYALLFAVSTALASTATVHTISVANFAFSPTITTAICGDTIRWVWSSGTHTTTSTTIPNCASAWNAQINSVSTTFSYVVPCAGTYNFVCNFHANMTGQIIVSCTIGINDPKADASSLLFPNPFPGKVTIRYHNADEVRFTNAVGEMVKSIKLDKSQNETEIDLAELAPGLYFCTTMREGRAAGTKKIVKQ